jgi:hypothetical protein
MTRQNALSAALVDAGERSTIDGSLVGATQGD